MHSLMVMTRDLYLLSDFAKKDKIATNKGFSCSIYRYFTCVGFKQLTFSEMIFFHSCPLNVKKNVKGILHVPRIKIVSDF